MVVRRAEGTDRCMEEEDLREREVVGPWRRSDKYGGARLWMALNVNRRILKCMRKLNREPVELLKDRSDVVDRGGVGYNAGS